MLRFSHTAILPALLPNGKPGYRAAAFYVDGDEVTMITSFPLAHEYAELHADDAIAFAVFLEYWSAH